MEAVLAARFVELVSRGVTQASRAKELSGLLIRPSAAPEGTLKPRSADPDGARDHFPDRHPRDSQESDGDKERDREQDSVLLKVGQ